MIDIDPITADTGDAGTGIAKTGLAAAAGHPADVDTVEGGGVLAALVDPELAAMVTDELVCAAFTNTQAEHRALFANQCRLLAEVERRRIWRHEGHASIYGWLRHRYGYSDAECRTRVTIARASLIRADVVDALAAGDIPVAHAEVLSRAMLDCADDDRVDRSRFDRELGFWLNETGRDYQDFRLRVTEWSTRMRPERALIEDQRRYESRHCRIRRRRDHMITIDALLDPSGGERFIEALGQLAGQAFDADWAEAQQRHGDRTTTANLARTDTQRQADALVQLAELAHANPNGGFAHQPLVTILIDEHTYTDAMIRLGLYPGDAGLPDDHLTPTQRWSRTNTGTPIHPYHAAQAALVGAVRFTMVDRFMHPIKATSQQRLFTGALREIVMATSPTCYWPGCNRPVNQCQADHYDEHHRGGPTALANGHPACGRHNRYKSTHHYQPERTTRGNWTLPRRDDRRSRGPRQQQLGIGDVRRQ